MHTFNFFLQIFEFFCFLMGCATTIINKKQKKGDSGDEYHL